jgi:hypothetical protein
MSNRLLSSRSLARFARAFLLACLAALMLDPPVFAHEVRPAYLGLQEAEPGKFDVLFKTPMRGDLRLSLKVSISGDVDDLTPVVSHSSGDAMIQTWRVQAAGSLSGREIAIDGLDRTLTDAMVRIGYADGSAWVARLTPSQPSAVVPAKPGNRAVFATYLRQGVEHIALGFDHLLFVAALMLIVGDWRKLVKTVTAFTIAHSITLTSATLGWLTLPPAPVETLIAISIALVAAEVVRMRRGRSSLAISSPWVVAFAFGLLHGFGFAGALAELGLPQGDIPLALLAFNIGVEVGQLAFIAVILAATALIRRTMAIPPPAAVVSAYAIGIVAAFWSVERLDAMFR